MVFTPLSLLSSVVVVDTPSNLLISAVEAVTPSKILSSLAVAVTFVPPISNVVKLNSPAIVTTPFESVIKSVSSSCPIVAPSILILSTANSPNVPTLVTCELIKV